MSVQLDVCPLCMNPIKIGEMRDRVLGPSPNSASGEALWAAHLLCVLKSKLGPRSDGESARTLAPSQPQQEE
jgi:hypothetical protein